MRGNTVDSRIYTMEWRKYCNHNMFLCCFFLKCYSSFLLIYNIDSITVVLTSVLFNFRIKLIIWVVSVLKVIFIE